MKHNPFADMAKRAGLKGEDWIVWVNERDVSLVVHIAPDSVGVCTNPDVPPGMFMASGQGLSMGLHDLPPELCYHLQPQLEVQA